MIKKTMTIQLQSGLEARPVALLVQVASQHECSIYVEADKKKVNAKSIMGMMTLGLAPGEQVTVTADGADEAESIQRYWSAKRREAKSVDLESVLLKKFGISAEEYARYQKYTSAVDKFKTTKSSKELKKAKNMFENLKTQLTR
jgi:catabolite repression HPr-like protein